MQEHHYIQYFIFFARETIVGVLYFKFRDVGIDSLDFTSFYKGCWKFYLLQEKTSHYK